MMIGNLDGVETRLIVEEDLVGDDLPLLDRQGVADVVMEGDHRQT